MGKPGAFLEIGRVEHGVRPASQTLQDFDDMVEPLSEPDQQAQASRCMMCGVAYCQTGICFGRARTSGCPLHNLIPEWNDLLYRGLWDEAAERLSLTNPFPEFTGRVCPALCEASCNLGLNEAPTTIRDNERAISDHAWASGSSTTKPLAPAPDGAPHVAVVGTGPSGLACGWELARRGFKVTMIERHDRPGGLLMYGIPNMKLPKEIVERRLELMRQSGIGFECETDATDPAVAARLMTSGEFSAVVVAAGAAQPRALKVPGADLPGVHFAVDYLTSATRTHLEGGAPAIDAAAKDVIVIGGGDTGTDCVATALRQGAASVHQLEFMPAPPDARTQANPWPEWPNVKKVDYGQLEAIERQGEDPRSWATNTLEVLDDGQGGVRGLKVVSLDWSCGKPEPIEGSERELPAQLVLIAMGFTGPEPSVLEALGCETQDFRGGVRPVQGETVHRAQVRQDVDAPGTPLFVCGDTRNGSTIVVNALSDGLACAAEVAASLAQAR